MNSIVNTEQMRILRAARMRSVMKEHGLGILLCFSPETISYLTGIEVPYRFRDTESFFLIFPLKGDMSLYAMSTEYIASKYPWVSDYLHQSISINSIFSDTNSLEFIIDGIIETMYTNTLEKMDIGIEGSTNSLAFADIFRPMGLHVVNARGCVNEARMIKFEEEIECLRYSASEAVKAYEVFKSELKIGMNDLQLSGIVREKIRESGTLMPKEITITSGTETNPPAIMSANRIIEYGDIVNIAIRGKCINGYSAFMYRTVVAGKASEEQKDSYRVTRDMLRSGVEVIRNGIQFKAVWDAMKTLTQRWGYDEFTRHPELCTVHSMGLSLFEYPSYSDLTFSSDAEFRTNMTVDTYVWGGYKGGTYGIRFNENLLITDKGSQSLTGSPEDEIPECGI